MSMERERSFIPKSDLYPSRLENRNVSESLKHCLAAKIRFFTLFGYALLCGFSCPSSLSAKQPAGASNTSKVLAKAEQALKNGQEETIYKSIVALESQLQEASGTCLESETKIRTILLLSNAYEKVHRYEDQELLLRKHAKLPELFRYNVQLKAALARSLFQQIRFEEAQQTVDELTSTPCANLSLEEKTGIAHLLAFRNDFIHNSLCVADRQCDQNRFEEALTGYKNILPLLERLLYPSEGSLVEKKRIRDLVLLRMAETLFCLQKFNESYALASKIDSRLFLNPAYQAVYTRRLALLSLLNRQLNDPSVHNYTTDYVSCTLPKFPDLTNYFQKRDLSAFEASSSLLLFLSRDAYKHGSSEKITSAYSILKNRNDVPVHLLHILKGLAASLDHNYTQATEELICGLKHPIHTVGEPFRECALAELAKCSLARLVLLSYCLDFEQSYLLVSQLIPILRTSQNPQTILQELAIEVFFGKKVDTAYVQSILDSIVASNLEYDAALHEAISQRIAQTENSQTEPEFLDEVCGEDTSASCSRNPLPLYLNARSSYLQATNDEIPVEKAQALLSECLLHPGLLDVRPQILCYLTELSLRSEQYAQASEYLHELIDSFGSYPPAAQIALSSLIAFESEPNTEPDRHYVSTYLLTRPHPDIHSYLALLHLFENYNQIFTPPSEPLLLFQQALIAREEARNYAFGSTNCTEPGTAKVYVENLLSSYNDVLRCLKLGLQKTNNLQCQNFFYGVLFKIHEEKVLSLLHHIESHSAFNELPQILLTSTELLQDDLVAYRTSIREGSRLLHEGTLKEISFIAVASSIMAHTFKRDLPAALSLANAAIQQREPTPPLLKSLLYLSKMLREAKLSMDGLKLFETVDENQLEENYELLLEIAIEKSLCLRELGQHENAMAILGWVINSQYPSSLRIKAMILRAEMYLSIQRKDLATRQLEAVQSKGGDWAKVAERKLKDLYGTN